MNITKIAEGLLETCFFLLGSATLSAVVVGYSIFIFKSVYRFIDKKEGNDEDH